MDIFSIVWEGNWACILSQSMLSWDFPPRNCITLNSYKLSCNATINRATINSRIALVIFSVLCPSWISSSVSHLTLLTMLIGSLLIWNWYRLNIFINEYHIYITKWNMLGHGVCPALSWFIMNCDIWYISVLLMIAGLFISSSLYHKNMKYCVA